MLTGNEFQGFVALLRTYPDSTPFQPSGAEALAQKPIAVFLPKELDQYVRMKPNRAEWLRRAISEAARRELMQE